MNTNTTSISISGTNNQIRPDEKGSIFIPYLKKCLREMPLCVYHELIGVQRFRLQHRVAEIEQAADINHAELSAMKVVIDAMSDFLKIIDGNIKECGDATPMGATPDYNDDMAAEVFLRAVRW